MTDDYIKRSDAIEAMCEQCEAKCFSVNDNNCLEYHVLKRIPAADVEPVRHGRWIEINTGNPQWAQFGVPQNKCSKCSSEFMNKTSFCPHCGAKMNKEEDDG